MISKRSVGVLLALVLLISAGTLIQDYRFDTRIAHERTLARAVDLDLASIAHSLADLRAAQASYVATGQTPGTWMTRASELLAQMKSLLETRRTSAPDASTGAKYDAALAALATLASIDGRARSFLQQDDRLHAADLVFIDAQSQSETLLAELGAVRSIEEQAASARIERWGTYRLAMNGLALALVGVIALYFGRGLARAPAAPAPTMAQMLRDLPPPVKTTAPLIAPPAVPAAQIAPGAPVKSPVSLTSAAELCVDLARVLDGRDVPALLERTAKLLDAKGIMIWSADTDGAMLRPSLCHGYSEKVIAKLRPLQVDADNVTSLAFRSMQPQALPGATVTDAAAIAVPLITSSGCVGVLAAEVRQSKPHPDLLPVARIVAAQFATLVAPADDAAHATAQG